MTYLSVVHLGPSTTSDTSSLPPTLFSDSAIFPWKADLSESLLQVVAVANPLHQIKEGTEI